MAPTPTLGSLFDELRAQNIVVLEDMHCCVDCGVDQIRSTMAANDQGYCTFQSGDTDRLRSKGHLKLLCGDFDGGSRHRVGNAVAATARRMGFNVRSTKGLLMVVELRNISGRRRIPQAPESDDEEGWARRLEIVRSLRA